MSPLLPKVPVLALSALSVLWPSTAESPAAPPAPGIQIEHRVIRVPAERPRYRMNRLPATRLAVTTPPARKPDGLAARAGRLFMGDGRYRPEPFPRPAR